MLRHRATPLLHLLNAVRLRAAPRAAELEALAERWQRDLPHRFVVIEDGAGEALAEELGARGWRRDRAVVMALDPARTVVRDDPRAGEVDEPTLRAVERAIFDEDNIGPGAHPALPAQLADAMADLRAATACRRFAAGQDRDPAAMATLFLDPDVDGARVAQVESVGTLRGHRGQGLATAAVSAALAGAREWGAELVALLTDADDWPQVWYASLGFRPVARQVAYVRAAAGAGADSGAGSAGGGR